jgi:predicted NBD/HSP70 family sugar kinase
MSTDIFTQLGGAIKPAVVPPLDEAFRPAALVNKAFLKAVEASGQGVPLAIGLERADGTSTRFDTKVFASDHPQAAMNLPYVERLVKFLLWQNGGYKVSVGGPAEIGEHIKATYSAKGARAFDAKFMGETTSEKPFEVVVTSADEVAPAHEVTMPIGRHLEGCRIGFDLGASDRKVAAVIDGESVFSEEVVWDPRDNRDPQYHFNEIMDGLKRAAEHLPRVDAIGGSSAGIIVNNRPMVASLFRGVPQPLFDEKVKPIFTDIGKAWGVPIEVVNDGDVTALAGAMSLNSNAVLGVAMGSSEAAGYVNAEGNITGRLNELAFAPIDYRQDAPADEWSGDVGCGVQYLTQQAVFRLARQVDIPIDETKSLADRLKSVQRLMEIGNSLGVQIWETIGCYTGYAIAHYATFYPIKHMLILGRVTSGNGGQIILAKAREVLEKEFPALAASIELHLPDETTRRVGQAVAAASLQVVNR